MASSIDEDTKRKVARGRATLWSTLGSARDDLRKAFIVFVIGFMGTFYVMRLYVWDRLKADLNTNPDINIVAVTPFDVVLLQAKIGLVVGILITIPLIVYYGRDALRARGYWPTEDVPLWKLAIPSLLATILFVCGIAYSYFLFFPLMLDFLAANAVKAGLRPNWSIVKWTQFIAFLSLSFGLAAQLPLAMGGLSYLRIVGYETFRNRWRHAVVAIFTFGAFFSPPDPFTQIMWAAPLVLLYGCSLQVSRFAELLRRSSEELSPPQLVRENWNVLAGVAVLAFAAFYLFFTRGGITVVNDLLSNLPDKYSPGPLPGLGAATGLDPQVAAGLVAAVLTVPVIVAVLFVLAVRELGDQPPAEPGAGRSPADIDLLSLDASAIGVAPPEAFEEMDEQDALELASEAIDADEPEKGRAILDRWDEVGDVDDEDASDAERTETAEASESAGSAESAESADIAESVEGRNATTADAAASEATVDDDAEDAGVFTSTTAGIVDAFSEDETTEEDIGGYYYDIAFILESLTSRAFRIVGLFMAVLAVTFVYLYRGGIGQLRSVFVDRMPPQMADQVEIVALHPVEALVFAIKFSTLLGLIATIPLLGYYMWPRLKERGLVGGDRRVLLVWGITLVVGVVVGSLVGFLYVAPAIISWLATDAIQAHMVINYRINNFGWLVAFTTVGIGLLVEIPITMLLFHRGGIVTFATMRDRWRTVVMGIVVASAFLTPSSVLTLLLLAIPTSLSYLTGLGILWVVTLGGRRAPRHEGEAAD